MCDGCVYIYILTRPTVGKLLLRCDPTCSSQSMVHVLSDVAGYVKCNVELVASILAFFLHHSYIQPLIYYKTCPGSRKRKTYNMSFQNAIVDINLSVNTTMAFGKIYIYILYILLGFVLGLGHVYGLYHGLHHNHRGYTPGSWTANAP